jgi:hypothetical protein
MENARLKDKPNYITYTTDSISVANDISRLAIHCGYSCHAIRSMSEYEPDQPQFRVFINKNTSHPTNISTHEPRVNANRNRYNGNGRAETEKQIID